MQIDFEDCNAEQQQGWDLGVEQFLNADDIDGDTIDEFMEGFKAKFPNKSEDFYNGALMGIKAENGEA